jgi:hypothetical protein
MPWVSNFACDCVTAGVGTTGDAKVLLLRQTIMGTKVYCFSKDRYARYDRADDRVDSGYPLPIAANWSGMSEAGFGVGIDAVANWENGKLYFFRGDQYLRYDVAADRVDSGYPLPIAGDWPGMAEAGFGSNITAAVNWGNGKAFFFRGDQYVRYDVAADRVDSGYPSAIAGNWPGMAEAGFGSNITAAVNWGNGKAFFFRGDQYVRYDVAADRVDSGYPLPIAGNWPGMAEAGFSQDISGAVDLFIKNADLWVPNAAVIKSPVNGPKFIPLPWRGVLHTTEGNTLEDAVQTFRTTNFWPHFTIEAKTLRIAQHLPLTVGARSLSDKSTPENAARCIQIEIVGRAAESPTWPSEHLAFIRDVMRQIEDLVPIPRQSGLKFLNKAGVNANPTNRMTVAQWQAFSGWCGHQHVPGENHWDPGAIDIDTLLS